LDDIIPGKDWAGMLTTENVYGVIRAMHHVLADRKFTFVTADGDSDFRPKIYPRQVLVNGQADNPRPFDLWSCDENSCNLVMHISSLRHLDLSSTLREQKFDPEFDNPYFAINADGGQIIVIHRSADKNKVYWIFTLEGSDISN